MLQVPPAGCSGRCHCSANWPGPVRSHVSPAWHQGQMMRDVPGCKLNGLLPRILLPTLKACLPVHPLCGSGLDRNQGRLRRSRAAHKILVGTALALMAPGLGLLCVQVW